MDVRRAFTLEVRLKTFFNPVLKLDVLLKFASKVNTSFWFNTYLVVRSKRAEPGTTAKQLWSCPARSPAPQICPWSLRGTKRNQKLNTFIEFCTLCGWKLINYLKAIIKR